MAYPSSAAGEKDSVSKEGLARKLSDDLDTLETNPAPQARKKDGMIGVVLVGLGRAGHFHMQSLVQLREVARLLWVVDIDKEKAAGIAESWSCQHSTSLDLPLADPEVNCVIIASATDTHFPYIKQSLEASKAVFAEKPISHTPEEVQVAIDLAKSKNLPFICAFQRRCDRNFRELKRQLDAGSIGAPKVIKSCSRDNPVPPMEYLRTSGGIFHDMLVHDFDMLDWLSGRQVPESVTSVAHCYDPEIAKMDDVDTCAVLFKYPSGLIAMVDTCRDAAYGYDQRIEVFGEKGMLTAKNEMTSSVELATTAGHMMPPAKWSFPQRYDEAYMVEIAEFVALLKGPDSSAHKLEQEAMMRHATIVRTSIAAELSWKLGRQVMMTELDELMAKHPAH
jgi:myo-inositol 2-dehydrogenase/D-chiro-inositol 1-dehydrogenase